MLFFAFSCMIWILQIHEVFSNDIWNDVPCTVEYKPRYCDFAKIPLITVDDFDRCGPAVLKLNARNYILGASGRRQTYKENKAAFRRIKIIPKVLRDVSKYELGTTILGQQIEFPVGISPVGGQKLAHPDGELATLAGISDKKTIMILSSYGSTTVEELAQKSQNTPVHLWMQTYIFKNRNHTLDIVRKAEKYGYKAIVVTADGNVDGTLTCRARNIMLNPDIRLPNLGNPPYTHITDPSANYTAIQWLTNITSLPIVIKGINSKEDAELAIRSGASAIMVSNHGGRQFDSGIGSIDALPMVVEAVRKLNPKVEVYLDGGVRSGYDVLKALARGAKMVFVGRPVVWGLALAGSNGVNQMMNILHREFKEALLLSGNSSPSEVTEKIIMQSKTC